MQTAGITPMDVGSLIAWVIIAAGVLQAIALLLQTREHCRYVRSCMGSRAKFPSRGRVLVISPCKGVDLQLADNLRAILDQDYDDYEVLFVVESEDDPACAIIRWVSAERGRGRLLVAGPASSGGRKVHKLLAATAEIDPEYELIAFVDSDARPRRDWLRMLCSRLDGQQYCAATGYRWFIPDRMTLPELLLYSINSALMTLLGKRSYQLVWGGSWAIRRSDFLRLNIREAWQGALSDDLAAAAVLAHDPRPTRFEPGAVAASPLRTSLAGLFEFLRRQYMMARFYAPGWWWFGLATLLPAAAVWPIAAWSCWHWGIDSTKGVLSLIAAFVLYGSSVIRAAMRQELVRVYFPDLYRRLWLARWFDIVAAPLATIVHAFGAWSSAFGRTLSWRGTRYRFEGDGQVRIIATETVTGEPAVAIEFATRPFDEATGSKEALPDRRRRAA